MKVIVEIRGKQYTVQEGDIVRVDRLDAEEGTVITFDKVLMILNGDSISEGSPLVSGASVSATVVNHCKGKKLIVFKYFPKKDFRKKQGHRQCYTKIKVDSISA